MPTEPTIRKSTHDLALLVAGNVRAAQLSPEVEKYYLDNNKDEVVSAICRGFVLPLPEKKVVEVVPLTMFKTTDTDLDWWLGKAEEFTKRHLGLAVNLRQQFTIPTELPYQSVIPIFDPGTLTNRDVFELIKKLGHHPWEEVDVMKYVGAEKSNAPTLHLIENLVRPNADTMGLSPDELRRTGKSYLRLRGYGLAVALYNFAKNEFLDPETFTWFPEDRLPDGDVANGDWFPDYRQVRFNWYGPGYRISNGGGRVAISLATT